MTTVEDIVEGEQHTDDTLAVSGYKGGQEVNEDEGEITNPEESFDKQPTVRKDTMAGQVGCFGRFARSFPRLYYFFTLVIVPLFGLIGIAFVCGYALAKLESYGEIDANDAFLSDFLGGYLDYLEERDDIQSTIKTVTETCFSSYDDNSTFGSLANADPELVPFLGTCFEQEARQYTPTDGPTYFADLGFSAMSFNWITCPRWNITDANVRDSATLQSVQYLINYIDDFETIKASYIEEGLTVREADAKTLEEATGATECLPHLPGGALFWYTIFTTIGYGNTAPVTTGGRALVFTLGFVSIIAFTALIGQAGYVTLVIVDDFLPKVRLGFFAKGWPAVLFWLLVLVAWIFFLAGLAVSWSGNRSGVAMPFDVAIWFSYITLTTVGFGDYHIRHEEFKAGDMFYLPLLVLMGFVYLANFALKLSEVLAATFPMDNSLERLIAKEKADKEGEGAE